MSAAVLAQELSADRTPVIRLAQQTPLPAELVLALAFFGDNH